ncbi:ArsR/SmtB family transcription factor [Demetria terragena]|uniref:ArsR/SmtB family transcription factor n=1 Tax=Demetria terragena TaxID=63959 RepID=UPI00037D8B7C|nr:helix-turn-helix domain-containing protein [Demetria terragena]
MANREIPTIHPDTDTLKAMSHPVRLRMLGLLRSEGPATASQLAQRLGLNSGATSYHLRQLADYGLVKDAPDRGNKRDRWWQAAHQSTRTALSEENDPDARAATMAFWKTAIGEQVRQIQAAAAELDELPREWADVSGGSDWGIRLTADQARELTDRIGALIDEAMANELPDDELPPDAEPIIFQVHAFPRPGHLTHRDEQHS